MTGGTIGTETGASVLTDPRDNTEGWTLEEQQRADELQAEGARLYRSLRAALRREPSPRELHRARETYFREAGR